MSIYVSSQGVKGAQTPVSPCTTDTRRVQEVRQVRHPALALEHDEDRDLVYVTDFGTGKVAVFDGRADEVIGEVEMNGAAANDVTLLKDGSVLVLDKKDRDEKVTLPYVLNGTTGEISTASEYTTLPTKDRQGNDVPASVQQLKANSILKFKVGLKDTDASAAPVGITPTSLDFAGYPTVTGVKAEESKPADPKAEDKKPETRRQKIRSLRTLSLRIRSLTLSPRTPQRLRIRPPRIRHLSLIRSLMLRPVHRTPSLLRML